MAEWKTTEEGFRICEVNPVKTAYKILKVLEEDKIPHGRVNDVWNALQSILESIQVIHSPDMEKHPNWPQ